MAEGAQVGLRCGSAGCSGAVVLSGVPPPLASLQPVPPGWLGDRCSRCCLTRCAGAPAPPRLLLTAHVVMPLRRFLVSAHHGSQR